MSGPGERRVDSGVTSYIHTTAGLCQTVLGLRLQWDIYRLEVSTICQMKWQNFSIITRMASWATAHKLCCSQDLLKANSLRLSEASEMDSNRPHSEFREQTIQVKVASQYLSHRIRFRDDQERKKWGTGATSQPSRGRSCWRVWNQCRGAHGGTHTVKNMVIWLGIVVYTPLIPAFGKQKQADLMWVHVQSGLQYSSRTTRAT